MKFRIIRRGDGKYQVQEKDGFFCHWQIVKTNPDDYGVQPFGDDYTQNAFSTLHLAQCKVNKLLGIVQQDKLKKEFVVIEESAV